MDSNGRPWLRHRSAAVAVTTALLVGALLLVVMVTQGAKYYHVGLTPDMQSSVLVGPFNGTLSSAGQFYRLLLQVETTCSKLVQVGGHSCNKQPRDQAEVCLDHDVLPPAPSCVVYTFGQHSSLAFEEGVMFGRNCTIHMFDPAYVAEFPVPIYLAGDEFHHPVGLHNTSNEFVPRAGRSNIDWKVVGAILGEYRPLHPTVHVLRISLHGAEWEALEQLSQLGLLDRVQQLLLSVHTLHLKGLPSDTWRDQLQLYQDQLSSVSRAGLQKVVYREYFGHLALVQMPGENLPRQACGRALYVRR